MERTRKSASTFLAAIIVLIAVFAFYHCSADDGRTPAERQQIASALLGMLRSPHAHELDDLKMDDLKPNDPRIPEANRALHPVRFAFSQGAAVVYCGGTPAEYILRQGQRNPQIWTLYIAGPHAIGTREV